MMKFHARMLVLAWALLVFYTAVGQAWSRRFRRNKHFFMKHASVDGMYSMDVPVLKMLKRQVRHFMEGHNASVTLVFRTSEPVHIRWFKRAPNFNMGSSEVPNMLPIEGDTQYEVSFMSSMDVVATTLTVPSFNMTFPQDFETIITNSNATHQYQLSTMIKNPVRFERTNVNSPEWLIVPPTSYRFHDRQHLKVHCRIFVPHDVTNKVDDSDKEKYTNELTLNQAVPEKNTRKAGMVFESLVFVHRDIENSTEDYYQTDGHEATSHIKTLKRGHAIYDVKMTRHHATQGNSEGIYQCAMDREHDKLYVLSKVSVYEDKNPLLSHYGGYRAEIMPCDGTKKHRFYASKYITPSLILHPDEPTCFRCRVMGHPQPEVGVFYVQNRRREEELKTTEGVGVTRYINVKDGGIPEMTVTVHDITSLKKGRYECRAYSNHVNTRRETQPFNIFY